MLLQASWKSAGQGSERSLRLRTPIGSADGWLKISGGKGALVLLQHVSLATRYLDPARYSAAGLLLALYPQLPFIDGSETCLRLIPALTEWNREEVLSIFNSVGLEPRFHNDALELRTEDSPKSAIERAAIVAYALDPFTRANAGPAMWEQARSLSQKLNAQESLRLLLDEWRGAAKLRELLGRGSAAKNISEINNKIIAALRQISTTELVHFHCGTLKLLRAVAGELALKTAIGVEPSKAKAKRRSAGYSLLHGSLIEPPDGLPASATALLIDALPPPDDLRLERAAEVLFRQVGFDWVLCLEKTIALERFGKLAKERFGYDVSDVRKLGSHDAILLRRTSSSCARTVVQPKAKGPAVQSWKRAPEAGAAVTLEAFSRLTVDPRWLFYLPAGISMLQGKEAQGDYEHPKPIFDYYRVLGITKLILEAKPSGSRAIVIVCRDDGVGLSRFGIQAPGRIYARTGRPLFDDDSPMLDALRKGLTRAHFWKRFETDWVCFEGVIFPSGKNAEGHTDEKHGEVLHRAETMYAAAASTFEKTGIKNTKPVEDGRERLRRYRVQLEQSAEHKALSPSFIPVHLIATEGKSHFFRSRLAHMETLVALSKRAGPPFMEMPYQVADVSEAKSLNNCVKWWEAMCAAGAEGVLIKTFPFLPKGKRGMAQPGFVCRGREHLRLVYGPEYDRPESRLALQDRKAVKFSRERNRMILKQAELAIEGVERFLRREPLERIEECVRGVLTLES